METTKKQTSNPWGLLIIVLILATAPPAALFKIASVQTTMMNSLGLTSTQVGLLSSAFSLASVVMAIPGGLIAAKFGNWKTGLLSFLAVIVGGSIGVFFSGLSLLILARIIEGIGQVLIGLVGPSVISQAFSPEKRGKAMGVFMTYMSIASVMAYNIFPRIAKSSGWKGTWVFTTVFALICLVVWALLKKPISSTEVAVSNDEPPARLRDVMTNKSVWVISLQVTLCTIAFQAAYQFLSNYLVTVRGLEETTAGSLCSISGTIGILGSILAGAISDKLHTRKWIVLILAVVCGVHYMLPTTWPTGLFAAYIFIFGLLGNGITPVAMTAATEVVSSPKLAGVAVALVTLMMNMGILLASPIFGMILDMTNTNWTIAYVSMGVISIVGGGLLLFCKKMK